MSSLYPIPREYYKISKEQLTHLSTENIFAEMEGHMDADDNRQIEWSEYFYVRIDMNREPIIEFFQTDDFEESFLSIDWTEIGFYGLLGLFRMVGAKV